MASPRTKMVWRKGPPPGRGQWWICWRGESDDCVLAVELSPAVINPAGPLLMKTLGGFAYQFEPNADRITHHAPLATPEAPRG